MIGIVATLKIKEGSGNDFEAVAGQLVEKVNANEDGVVYYDLYKEDDTTYIFLERYKDEAAQAAHGQTEYFKELGAKMGAFMAGAPEVKVLQSV
jgi:quinol monooxygenase YgiN